jgi:hydroxymethylpyrimidine pyrophosphatase-like HAD family hydrolase
MNLPVFSDKMPRAVALDLDGTALNSASRLSDRTSNAVLRLLDMGIPIVIATARPERVIHVLTGDEIAKRASLVHLSGAAALGRDPLAGTFNWGIDPDEARLCWDIVSASPLPSRMTVELDGRRFAVSHESDADELWTFNTATPDMIVSLEEALASNPAKVSVNGIGNNLGPIVEELRSTLSESTLVVPAVGNSFINVHSRLATKSGAVAALLASKDIPLSDVLSFGDDYPDVDLMLNTGWPVAVANAIPEVRQAAQFETASNDDDGVAHVLEDLMQAHERHSG